MVKPAVAGTGRATIRVLPGVCDKVRQVARFIAVVGGDVDVGPRRGAVRMDGGITDLGQGPTASEGVRDEGMPNVVDGQFGLSLFAEQMTAV